MLIRARETFLHGRVRFEPNTIYSVPEALGYYFATHRWAEPLAEAPEGEAIVSPDPASLSPHAPTAPAAPGEAHAVSPDDAKAQPGS